MGEADKIDLGEVRRSYEAIERRDWPAAQTLQHPEMEWHDPPEAPDAGVHVGHEEIRRYWEEELFDAWEEWRFDVRELIPSGDQLLADTILHAKARHSGIEQEIVLYSVFTFKNGLAIEQRAFVDREQAFAAAGLDFRPVEPATD
jgi:ketosteroid isomerase-like protein